MATLILNHYMRSVRYLDAANVNLKSFNNGTYQKLNGGNAGPCAEHTSKRLHERGVHFEMTTLVVPGYVDDEKMIKNNVSVDCQ